MRIERTNYLTQLINKKHNGLVKIVSGIRRCGKSYLLFRLFKQHLLDEGVSEKRIITLALDDYPNMKYRQPDECYNYVKSHIIDSEMHYLLLDEVQLMDNFSDVLNGFLHIENLDVYVTGSNSKFLSTDIVTEFRGRGDEIRVYPLSFAEFFFVHKGAWVEAWKEYYTYGGMPMILSRQTDEEKRKYLQSLFAETYIQDIKDRHNIRNDEELEELINILASDIGCLVNPLILTNTFKSVKKLDISAPTIKTYIGYLQDSFLISNALRYDIKGKKYINTPSKYYFTDLGLRNSRLRFRQTEESHIMENVIYNELKIRGCDVDVGEVLIKEKQANNTYINKKTEVDFVVNCGYKKYYIQSALQMPTKAKETQEKRSLLKIGDSFKKIIIVKDDVSTYQDDDGILILGLKEFLLNPHCLDI